MADSVGQGSPVIVLTGGGSGGHITPVLAIAHEIKQLRPDIRTVYIGQKGDGLNDIITSHDSIDQFQEVSAGKLRRYHGAGLVQLLDMHTNILNLRDMFRTCRGLWTSYWLLRRLKPQIVFVKGGFVGVPVGLAAAMLGIPYVTHDSDAIPGLANRIIARWASIHAVALPKELYGYPQSKTVTVGVPISSEYQRVTDAVVRSSRSHLNLPTESMVVLVAGGGLGAQRVNTAVCALAPRLLHEFPRLVILHQAGRAHVEAVESTYNQILTPGERERVRVVGFVTDMYHYSAAADIVIARAGGTNLAELAMQGKACVVVPNPYLTGGHQLKNAKALADSKAVIAVNEDQLQGDQLYESLRVLLRDPQQRAQLADGLHGFAIPDAAMHVAQILIDAKL